MKKEFFDTKLFNLTCDVRTITRNITEAYKKLEDESDKEYNDIIRKLISHYKNQYIQKNNELNDYITTLLISGAKYNQVYDLVNRTLAVK